MTHKRNRSIENKIQDCLDKIGNLHPDLRARLEVELLNHPLANSVSKLQRAVAKMLILPTYGRATQAYWLSRGWNEQEAYYKAKQNVKTGVVSPYSRQFWLLRINLATNKHYTEEEADFERNSRRPIRKEYWIKRGHSNEEAEQLAIQAKHKNNIKGNKTNKGNIVKVNNPICLDYWLLRGYTLDEAKLEQSNRQKTFTLEKCIEKYGEEKGTKVWQDRQDKWQSTLNSKSEEEIKEINIKKNPYRLENFDSVDAFIDHLNAKGIKIYRTIEEVIGSVEKDLATNPFRKYWPPEKYVEEKINQKQLLVLEIDADFLLKKIQHLFDPTVFIRQSGTITSYMKWVDEGLLRSSFEMYFYDQVKNINPNAIKKLDDMYPNSRCRCDFLLDNGDYIEICPILDNVSKSFIVEKYEAKMNKKRKLFNPIFLKNTKEIDDYLESYKTWFLKNNEKI